MDRNNIDKIARTPEDRLLLAKLWDKVQAGIRRNVPASTSFLSPREQELARYLFGQAQGLCAFGGYAQAERKMLVYLPEYLDESALWEPGSPCVCLRAAFYRQESPSHRDFLGAILGLGLTREKIGDLLVGEGVCQVLLLREVERVLLTQLSQVGRARVKVTACPLAELRPPEQKTRTIRDTVAALRLDAVASTGFSLSRSKMAALISSGKLTLNGRECDKPDRLVEEGAVLTCRGLGKCVLTEVNGASKKGRVMIVMERYL